MEPTTLEIITGYYESILQRSGDELTASDQQSIQSYAAAVESNAITLEQARAALINSSAGQDVQDVVRLYGAIFGRVPDEEGLDFQVDALRDGYSIEDVANGFAASDEFFNRFGSNQVNEAFLNSVYQTVFNRTPSADEINFYLESGFSAGRVLLAFSESPEYREDSQSAVEEFLDTAAQGTQDFTGPLIGDDVTPAPTANLTREIETVTGTDGDDIISGVISGADTRTFQTGDSIDGRGGNDTLRIISTSGATIIPAALTSVENIEIQDFGGATIDLTNATGVETIASTGGNDTTDFDNVGNLVDVAFRNSQSGLDINFRASVVAGANDAINVELDSSDAYLEVDGVETINLAVSGDVDGEANEIFFGSAVTTLNIAGAGSLVASGLGGTLETVAAAAATGDITLNLQNTDDVSVTTGSGDDTFLFDASFDADDTVNGGEGFDELRSTTSGDLSLAAGAAPFNALTSVERVAFDGTGVTLNGATFTNAGITNIEFNTNSSGNPGDGDDVINNAGSARTYEFGVNNDGDATFNLNGTSTTLNIDLLGTEESVAGAADGISANVEDIEINLSGTAPAGTLVTLNLTSAGNLDSDNAVFFDDGVNNVGEITVVAGSTVNIDGSGNLDIAGFTNSIIVNASALTGDLEIEGSDFTQFATAVGADVAPTPGSPAGPGPDGVLGDDPATAGVDESQDDVAAVAPTPGIDNNGDGDFTDPAVAAADFVSGADTITLGSGQDTVVFSSGLASGVANTDPSATNSDLQVDVINSFTAGANGDVLDARYSVDADADYTALAAGVQANINALSGNAGPNAATLTNAANLAATATAGDEWTAFTFQGETYALYNNVAGGTYDQANDLLVRLSGVNVASLTDDNFA